MIHNEFPTLTGPESERIALLEQNFARVSEQIIDLQRRNQQLERSLAKVRSWTSAPEDGEPA